MLKLISIFEIKFLPQAQIIKQTKKFYNQFSTSITLLKKSDFKIIKNSSFSIFFILIFIKKRNPLEKSNFY